MYLHVFGFHTNTDFRFHESYECYSLNKKKHIWWFVITKWAGKCQVQFAGIFTSDSDWSCMSPNLFFKRCWICFERLTQCEARSVMCPLMDMLASCLFFQVRDPKIPKLDFCNLQLILWWQVTFVWVCCAQKFQSFIIFFPKPFIFVLCSITVQQSICNHL